MKVQIFKTKIPYWDWQYAFGDKPGLRVPSSTRKRWLNCLADYEVYQSELRKLYKEQNESVD